MIARPAAPTDHQRWTVSNVIFLVGCSVRSLATGLEYTSKPIEPESSQDILPLTTAIVNDISCQAIITDE